MSYLLTIADYAEKLLPIVTLVGAVFAVTYIGYVVYQLVCPLRKIESKMDKLENEACQKVEAALKIANLAIDSESGFNDDIRADMNNKSKIFEEVLNAETKDMEMAHGKVSAIYEAKRRRILEKLPLLKK